MPRFSIAVLVLLSLALPASAQSDRRILLRNSFANAKEKDRQPKPKRSRPVEPDFAALTAPSLKRNEHASVKRSLSVALFDDTILHIELDRVERNGIDATVWSGRIEGEPASSVDIVVKDDALIATISTNDSRYVIEPSGNGTHEALELDLAAFPSELDPIAPLTANATAPATAVANDSAQYVDVLVVYTDDLRASLGGTSAAQAAASNAIAATNTAYQNSGVTMRVRLAGTAEVTYNDNGDLEGALYALTNTDGVIDEVHSLRNQYGADDVAMITLNGTGGVCGIGWLMSSAPSAGFASSAFNVTRYSCSVGNLSFPHELGHNFGLDHDRYVSPTGNPSWPYAFGYIDSLGQFRDIMAYGNGCNGCTRVQYFSNPNISYLGRPLGIASPASNAADNVRALNNNASTIANWRQSVIAATPAYTPATFTDNPLVARSSRVKLLHLTELRTAINAYRASVGLAAYTWTTVGAGGLIRASHITEMRTALTQAIPGAAFTDPTLGAGAVVKTVHIQELRNYLD